MRLAVCVVLALSVLTSSVQGRLLHVHEAANDRALEHDHLPATHAHVHLDLADADPHFEGDPASVIRVLFLGAVQPQLPSIAGNPEPRSNVPEPVGSKGTVATRHETRAHDPPPSLIKLRAPPRSPLS